MKVDEIFYALQAGELSSKAAEEKLIKVLSDCKGQSEREENIPLNVEPYSTASAYNEPSVAVHELDSGIVQVTMQDRVNKNIFSQELIAGLNQAFAIIEANLSYKVVILTGYDSYFASGGTKEGLLDIYEGKSAFNNQNSYCLPLYCSIPVIAAMQGHGIGAGWSMGMFCDFHVMSQESIYTSNYMNFGFTPGAGATLIFPEKFGLSLAQEILFTGNKFRGAQLREKGVPFPVLPREEVLPWALQFARNLAASPRQSLVALKGRMTEAIRGKLPEAIAKELRMHDKTFVHQEEVRKRIEALYPESMQKSVRQGKDTAVGSKASEGITIPLPNIRKNDDRSEVIHNGIAIIGMSGQFPKAKTLEQFWRNLANGVDCVTEIPANRWPISDYYDADGEAPGKTHCKWMGALEGVDQFDPLFFNISPAEAELMDPQQRIFLENCWHCIEDAGISPFSLSGSRCGVFVGCSANDYGVSAGTQQWSAQTLMGGSSSILSARISYLLNLKGPCLAIDTACSSSLVAIAEACNSLLLRTSDLALAGGVCVLPGPAMHIAGSKAGMLSKDGRCFTFDSRANGFVPGEGVGVILLKRLEDAIADEDPICGVIRGWGINQDGKTNGITAPSVNSQILLEEDVYRRFHINPESISLVEAHGTGTKLGDPIEVDALTASFQTFTQKKNYCALGSVKSNIGHLLTAAGVSGVIKVLLAMKYRMLPPTIHYERVNEHISLADSPFYINTACKPWEVAAGTSRCASVSSFGFSGTNAHIVIEEYCPVGNYGSTPLQDNGNQEMLFVLSGKTAEQVKRYAQTMKEWVSAQPDSNLVDIAYTLQVGREAMDYRLAFVVSSRDALLASLEKCLNKKLPAGMIHCIKKTKEEVQVFANDNASQYLLKTWLQEKNLQKIAESWVKGVEINWQELYGADRPRRISIPGYPFAAEHYWIPTSSTEKQGEARDNGQEESTLLKSAADKFSVNVTESHVMYAPVWDVIPVPAGEIFPSITEKVIIIGGASAHWQAIKQYYPQAQVVDVEKNAARAFIVEKLENIGIIDHIFWIVPDSCPNADQLIAGEYKRGIIQGFRLIKALLHLGYGTRNLGWSIITTQAQPVYPNEPVRAGHAGVHGLIGTMAKEYPEWRVRLVDLPDNNQWTLAEILTLPADEAGNSWAYRYGEWYRQKVMPVHYNPSPATLYRQGGVYVVIGGAGGIGELWSEYMIRTYGAQIIWIGRSKKDKGIQAKLDALAAIGTVPYYISADAADSRALGQAYEEILAHFTTIHGIIHSAVGEMDQSLENMEEERFQAGLSTKVDVSVGLAKVFGKQPLDFVLFFSSLAAFGKPFGQASYAAGCVFKDAFAHQLSREWSCAVKVMNWGYWGNIGIGGAIPNSFRIRLSQAGLGNIEPQAAMVALETLLSGPMEQLAFMKTSKTEDREELQMEEFITVYPQDTTTYIQGSRNYEAKPFLSVADTQKYIDEMEELLIKLLACHLQSVEKGQVIKLYDRWYEESIKIVEENNKQNAQGRLNIANLWKEWDSKKQEWLADSDRKAQVVLAETTMRSLPEILTGKVAATDLMFPDSSLELVEKIYKGNRVTDYFNDVLSDELVEYVKDRIAQDSSARIRILEIGAGTGGTSAAVLEKLRPYRQYILEYCYTDVSKAFLLHAEQEFGADNPYLTYKIFNVEVPLVEQNIQAGQYDAVIATNVLHATKNIRQTLRNTKALLRTNGLAFINEVSKNTLFAHLTFGLLSGWWLYEDSALRLPGSPILSPVTWRTILGQEGFTSVIFPAEKAHDAGLQVIIAESDGIIRHKGQIPPDIVVGQSAAKVKSLSEGTGVTPSERKQESVRYELLKDKATSYLKKVVGEILKIPANKIDVAEPLEIYGIDSILVGQLNNRLRKAFTDISNTLFFEYQTIDALAEYFITTQRDVLLSLLGLGERSTDRELTLQENAVIRSPDNTDFLPHSISKTSIQICSDVEDSEREKLREPIAIIGMSGRYPQARTMEEYWEKLCSGQDCITTIPPDRWELEGFFTQNKKSAVPQGKSYSKWGGFVDGFADFDPLFFNISPLEATNMDPQERLFIQSCWEVFEDAGYNKEQLDKYNRRIGVFAGITRTGFDLYGPAIWKEDRQFFPHTSFGSVANRISYLLNLQGPSMPIDTMCSSSLTAIHEACEHLYRKECTMAIAGGVNLYLHPSSYIQLCRFNMLSSDGKCRSFGAGADGFVPGEGVGCLLLKPLSQAVADNDHIYAVIRGTSINHGGRTNGYTVPNPHAQGAVIREALDKAGIDARTVSYIETHGTGTELGDPIEITGLSQAFAKDTQDTGFCAIGSVKSNIGHLEAAAGIAGISKIILQMRHKKIVPSLHAKNLNSHINFAKTPFIVQQELAPWQRPVIDSKGEAREYPRRAGISSFGAGGSNAHVVLEEYIPAPREDTPLLINLQNPAVILLSARDGQRLKEEVERLLAALEQQAFSQEDLGNIAYTLQVGREAMEERLGLLATSIQELQEKLQGFLEGQQEIADVYRGQVKGNKENLGIFSTDEELREAVEKWLKRGKYARILELWVKGLTVNWSMLYSHAKPYRISLPCYPFAREKYWVPQEKSTSGDNVTPLCPEQDEFPLLTFTEKWQEQALPAAALVKVKTMVCFVSRHENQQEILAAMKVLDQQAKVIFIVQGTAFAQLAPNQYCISRGVPESYEEALRRIRAEYGRIDVMLYLWAIEDPSCIQDYDIIFHIVQGMATAKLQVNRCLLGARYKDDLERCYLESWIGFERSLGLVMPNLQVAVICQSGDEAKGDSLMKAWLEKAWTEMQLEKVQSVLYQSGKRHILAVQPIKLTSGHSLLKTGGTYLITGGCGGLGLLFAEYFAKKHPVKLILTGRSSLDEKKQKKLAALRNLGSEIFYIQADVCDVAGMQRGLRQAKEKFGAIHGVIHAAGIRDGKGILEKSLEEFHQVIAPKIQGTLVLDELLAEEPLDFISYFSSSAAILGDFGSCDYAIGNRFQMVYARCRNERVRQGKTIVINWPLWRDGGMSIDNEEVRMYLQSSKQRFLEADEGVELFEQILSHSEVQQLVLAAAPGYAAHFFDTAKNEVSSPAVPALGSGRRPEMKGFTVEQCVEWELKEQISDVLKIPRNKLDREKNLADFGFDSISLAQLAAALSSRFGLELTPALFFGHSTLAKLTSYFSGEHKESMQIFYQEGGSTSARPLKTPVPAPTPSKLPSKAAVSREEEALFVPEPIAVIGMSGKFPDAQNVEEMWNILEQGRDAVGGFCQNRFSNQALDSTFKCGHIPGVSEFDAGFFEISPREAMNMDPRQRLLLQESWKALEDAGYGPAQIQAGKIGMFVGAEEGDYGKLVKENSSITANNTAVLAARLAYFLNLSGPVMNINTACSSGLVAAHQACWSLRNKECDTAIAAGVALLLTTDILAGMRQAGMLSEEGKCFAFDKRADGMVPGEAVVAVVLKRLSQAETDGDPIYAVIRGSGINYDGKTNGITAPSGVSQSKLMKDVYDQYHINPEKIEYIVTHGTGTKLGDSVELNALVDGFKDYTQKQGVCALTSAKTNFGHTLAASGLVSLVSLIQAFRHEVIPASLHCEQENEHISWDKSFFYVNKNNKSWTKEAEKGQLGAISAFGMSGTNAHMVLENYTEVPGLGDKEEAPYCLFVFSAKTKEALQEKLKDMLAALESRQWSKAQLRQISCTLLTGRQHFRHRCALIFQDVEDGVYALQQCNNNENLPALFKGEVLPNFQGQEVTKEYGQKLLLQSQTAHNSKENYRKILCALAELYCQGYDFSWDLLYGSTKPSRIHLPTYPFARTSYWITEKDRVAGGEMPAMNSPGQVQSAPGTLKERTGSLPLSALVSAAEISTRFEVAAGKAGGILLSSLSDKPALLAQPEFLLDKKPLSLQTLQEELAVSLANILYMGEKDVDIDKEFISMGLDSIIGVEWVKILNKQYQASIQVTKLYAYPTIRQLAGFFMETLENHAVELPAENAISAAEPSVPPTAPVTLSPIELPDRQDYSAQGSEQNQNRFNSSNGSISTDKLQEELVASLAEVLYMEQNDVNIDTNFVEMGLDSILGVEWIKAINKKYGTAITVTKVYDYSCIREFTEFLLKEFSTRQCQVTPNSAGAATVDSLQELLQRVHEGALDIEQAYPLLNQFVSSK